jgi:hypothetical protein
MEVGATIINQPVAVLGSKRVVAGVMAAATGIKPRILLGALSGITLK